MMREALDKYFKSFWDGVEKAAPKKHHAKKDPNVFKNGRKRH